MLDKISVVSGENFGTTNIYIRVKQQRHKGKKVFTDKFLIRYTHKAFTHTLTEARQSHCQFSQARLDIQKTVLLTKIIILSSCGRLPT